MVSKDQLAFLYEAIEKLDDTDLILLSSLEQERPVRPFSIASQHYLLPKDLHASLRKLEQIGFVKAEHSHPDEDLTGLLEEPFTLTEKGEEAKSMTSMLPRMRQLLPKR